MNEQPKKYITPYGNKTWHLPSKGRGHYHRLDCPAGEYVGGTKEWWVDDKRQR